MFGMPTDDDGSRDDMLLSERAVTVTRYEYDLDAIKASPTRVVLGVGEETGETITARTARAVADRLGVEPWSSPATTAVSSAAARRTRTPASRSSSASRSARCSTSPEPAGRHAFWSPERPERMTSARGSSTPATTSSHTDA